MVDSVNEAVQQEQYLKMAIQTILFNHKNQLDLILQQNNSKMLDQIAWEITSLAKHFEKLTNETMKGLE